MADVIVERDGDRSNSGPIVAIVIIAILVLAALFILPGLFGNGGTTNTSTDTGTGVQAPTPTVNTVTPNTGQ